MAQDLTAYAHEGYKWCQTPSTPALQRALRNLRHMATSPAADAFLIGAWLAYWRGRPPRSVATSRGHTYRVNGREIVRVVDPFDHRDGVAQA